jgi:hypothetical protein
LRPSFNITTDLHERVFSFSSKTGHVHPTCRVTFPEVITLVLDGTEGDTSKTVNLEDTLGSGVIRDNENVGFLSDSDLVTDGVGALALDEGVESEVVETSVGKTVSIVCSLLAPALLKLGAGSSGA